ncbi:uncharacterized protein Dvar_66880 [Desulfosarcina variabilis str. Montpellier]|uniref:hypothetical protein n=1 Tax=Desulfosarcina variabilis TaxID=2300 RepID=UPI003AFA2527
MNQSHIAPIELLETIIKALENSGQLSESVIAFIETALFPAQPKALAAFLTDDESESERDSLLDLIFSPDLAVQMTLEPLLEAACWSAQDRTALQDQLQASPIRAWIKMPDGRQLACILVPDYIKSRFLERLNLSWQLEPGIRASMDEGLSPAMALKVKVRLRNANLRPNADQQTVLCRFFERMADDDPDYLACMDLFLSLLGKDVNAENVYDRLAAHKRFLFRSLQQAKRFEALLRHSNMETLMLQGVRAPHAPQDELNFQMRLIDLICARLFGKTEIIVPPMDAPLRVVTDLDTPDAAVQSLMDS